MGGRIASQIGAAGADVEGLVFLGYPLHPPGKVDQLRAKHLSDIKVPMLFIQGSRDTFGTPDELRPIIKKLEALPTIRCGRRRPLLQGLEARGYSAGRRL